MQIGRQVAGEESDGRGRPPGAPGGRKAFCLQAQDGSWNV